MICSRKSHFVEKVIPYQLNHRLIVSAVSNAKTNLTELHTVVKYVMIGCVVHASSLWNILCKIWIVTLTWKFDMMESS
jgi:hypothetical protein